jgi:hypothetical protein
MVHDGNFLAFVFVPFNQDTDTRLVTLTNFRFCDVIQLTDVLGKTNFARKEWL